MYLMLYYFIVLYVLVYTPSLLWGLRSLPESVQTNLSKIPPPPKIICPPTWSLFPGGVLLLESPVLFI